MEVKNMDEDALDAIGAGTPLTKNIEDKEEKPCNITNLMEKFGRYQFIQYVLLCLPGIFISMISVNYVFTVGEVNYRCKIDGCEDENSTSQHPSWWPDPNMDRCLTPLLKSGEEFCTNSSFTGQLATCEHFIYENNNTVIADLNLGCEPWKSNLVGTIHNMGMLISMIVSGWISDKYGRKPALVYCTVGGCIGYIKTFATSYYMYITVEFFEASITGGSYAPAMVILLEIVGKRHRVLSGIIFAYAVYFGESLFAVIAMYVPKWKHLVYIINGSCFFFISLIFLLNESPRWLLTSGRIDAAKKIMKKIAKDNKIYINNEDLLNIDGSKLKEKWLINGDDVNEGFKEAFKSKEIVKRLIVACVAKFTCNFVYYGALINSVWLPGDKHLNFLYSSLMSFPGELLSLYLMNKIGRKIPLLVGYVLCGAFCILSVLIPEAYLWVKLSLFLMAKLIISACFTGIITYSMELFPTSVRGSLLGVASFAAQVGSMLAPLTPLLNNISEALPFTFFGCSAILAGILLSLTPETRDLPLFDTIDQIENQTTNQTKINENSLMKEGSKEAVSSV